MESEAFEAELAGETPDLDQLFAAAAENKGGMMMMMMMMMQLMMLIAFVIDDLQGICVRS